MVIQRIIEINFKSMIKLFENLFKKLFGKKDLGNSDDTMVPLNLYIFQNSYGGGYGVKLDEVPMGGVFYIAMDYFDKVSYTGWVNLDMEKDLASFIKLYAQKNVRDPETGGIFLISAGKKRPFPDMFTYICWNPSREAYTNLDEDDVNVLIDIPYGPTMRAEESPLYKKHKAQLKELTSPQNFEKLEELLHQQ